jgi:hypothetical protein
MGPTRVDAIEWTPLWYAPRCPPPRQVRSTRRWPALSRALGAPHPMLRTVPERAPPTDPLTRSAWRASVPP